MKRYLSRLEHNDGLVIIGHTTRDRHKRLTDLWLRFRFLMTRIPVEFKVQRMPFRLIKSLRAALATARTFDMNIVHPAAPSSGPTSRVGKDGDNGDSPLRGDTATWWNPPQSGQRIDESSKERELHSFSI